MASTTFELTIDRAMTPAEQEHMCKVLEPIAAAHGMLFSTEVVEPSFTYKIEQDRDPINPREDDNVGVMFCKHGRYRLGDKNAEDPVVTYGYVDLGGYKLYFEGCSSSGDDDPPKDASLFYEVLVLLKEWAEDLRSELDAVAESPACEAHFLKEIDEAMLRTQATIRWLDNLPYCNESAVRDDIAICLPLYLYDHSGITISHGRFSCPWDSGQVGWHYITKAAADENWPGWTEEQLEKCLECELKTYDDYLRGNVWGYVIEDEDGDNVDSCWGFYGDDLEETGILGHVEDQHVEGIKEAWERRFG